MKLKLNKSVITKILIIAISVVGISFLSVWAFRQYKELKKPMVPAINAIPDNTAFFIEIRNFHELWNKVNQPYSIWKTLTEISSFNEFNNQIIFLDSITKTNQDIYNILNDQPIYIAITFNLNKKFSSLFLIDLVDKQQSKTISGFISNYNKNDYVFKDISQNEVPLYELMGKKSGKKTFYSLFKGVFIAGLDKDEVFNSASKLNSSEPLTKKNAFSKIYNTAGKNVDANFYLNLAYIQRLLNEILIQDNLFLKESNTIENGWMALDIKMKDNLMLLNGFTNNGDTSLNILNLFKNDEPQTIEITEILPDNTSMFLFFGFTDYNKFSQSLISLGNGRNVNDQIKAINKKYEIGIERYFKYWIGRELALFTTPCKDNEKESNYYLAINTIDKKTALERFTELAEKTQLDSKRKYETYQGYALKQININNLLPLFFGNIAENINQNYFTIINDYVVFSNSIQALKDLIDKNLIHSTLEKNTIYNTFAENLSNNASIYLYVNVPKYLNTLTNSLNQNYKNNFTQNIKVFNQFQSFAMQIMPEKDLFYNTICFDYKTISINKPSKITWKLDLDTLISGKPYIVKNFNNKTNEILITDAFNQLYLIENNGKLLWKKPIKEKIISNIYQIDFYNNGKFQFLFNTENQIYLIDHNGKDVEDYPVKMKSRATNGMLAVYYPDIKSYRIYLACENKKIISLSKDASLVDGWRFKNTKNMVNRPIQHFVINNNDYLVFSDKVGNIFILDRKGISKMEISKDIILSENNTIVQGKNISGSESSLIFTDKTGEINFVGLPSGKIKKEKIKAFSPEHYFLCADLNNDQKKEYLFIDNTTLEIYNSAKKLIYNYQFINPVKSNPLLIVDNEQLLKFGIMDNSNSQLLLFSYTNNTFNLKEPLPCNSQWIATHLTNNQSLNIITISDKTIYNYEY